MTDNSVHRGPHCPACGETTRWTTTDFTQCGCGWDDSQEAPVISAIPMQGLVSSRTERLTFAIIASPNLHYLVRLMGPIAPHKMAEIIDAELQRMES